MCKVYIWFICSDIPWPTCVGYICEADMNVKWCSCNRIACLVMFVHCSHCYLARSANLLTGLYILPSVISFLTWEKFSQGLLDQFSWCWHQMKGICVNFLDLDPFYSFRDVAMATDFGQNLQNDLYSTCWHFATDISIPLSRW